MEIACKCRRLQWENAEKSMPSTEYNNNNNNLVTAAAAECGRPHTLVTPPPVWNVHGYACIVDPVHVTTTTTAISPTISMPHQYGTARNLLM